MCLRPLPLGRALNVCPLPEILPLNLVTRVLLRADLPSSSSFPLLGFSGALGLSRSRQSLHTLPAAVGCQSGDSRLAHLAHSGFTPRGILDGALRPADAPSTPGAHRAHCTSRRRHHLATGL